MAARWTPEQMAYVNSPRKMHELAEWVLTNPKAGSAQRKILDFAGLSHRRDPHDLMVSYVGDCIWHRKLGGHSPQNTIARQLIDEHIAYERSRR